MPLSMMEKSSGSRVESVSRGSRRSRLASMWLTSLWQLAEVSPVFANASRRANGMLSTMSRAPRVARSISGLSGRFLVAACDLPHLPEPDMTFYSPLIAAATATTSGRVGPVRSQTWDGSERYGRYGPNTFGD
jgi:hypothetical protein